MYQLPALTPRRHPCVPFQHPVHDRQLNAHHPPPFSPELLLLAAGPSPIGWRPRRFFLHWTSRPYLYAALARVNLTLPAPRRSPESKTQRETCAACPSCSWKRTGSSTIISLRALLSSGPREISRFGSGIDHKFVAPGQDLHDSGERNRGIPSCSTPYARKYLLLR